MISRMIAGQFRQPHGLLGRYFGRAMAQSNAYEALWTVSLLELQVGDHVLEIGFGPGVGLAHAAEQVVDGVVTGIDLSPTMLQIARARNGAAIRAGRVILNQGDVAALPYADSSFDKVFSIHCVYFWGDPQGCLGEVRRVLKPGGCLAVTLLPKDRWPAARTPPLDLGTLYAVDDVAQLFTQAGLRDVRVERSPEPERFPGVSIIGRK